MNSSNEQNSKIEESEKMQSAMHEVLFHSVEKIMHMTPIDKNLCYKYFKPYIYPKGTLIEKARTVHHYQNFVVSGHLRNFHHNENGEEVTVDINEGPRFLSSYVSMMDRKASKENIHCITDCEVLRVHRDDIDVMLAESPILKDYTIYILQYFLEMEKQRLTEMATLTAEERYGIFVRKQPAINRHVPLQYIASYLGMKPESLSRIRRKFIS